MTLKSQMKRHTAPQQVVVPKLTRNHIMTLKSQMKATHSSTTGQQRSIEDTTIRAAIPSSSPMVITATPGDLTIGTNPVLSEYLVCSMNPKTGKLNSVVPSMLSLKLTMPGFCAGRPAAEVRKSTCELPYSEQF